MDFFVRYCVELDVPVAAVETALDELPEVWLAAMADRAHDRAVGFMLEADSRLADDLAGTVVELAIEPPSSSGPRRSGGWPGR